MVTGRWKLLQGGRCDRLRWHRRKLTAFRAIRQHGDSTLEHGDGCSGILPIDVELRAYGANPRAVTVDDKGPRGVFGNPEERLTLEELHTPLVFCQSNPHF